jgi:hypothetical protein
MKINNCIYCIFKLLKLCLNFYLNHVCFKVLMLCMKNNYLRFYDSFLRFQFVLYFSCRVKNTYLTTLTETLTSSDFKTKFENQLM